METWQMHFDPLALASICTTGLLAGEEFVIRFGVRGPLARLGDEAHITMRQGLIRSLRVLVPIIFGASLLSGIGATALHWSDDSRPWHLASVALLLTFMLLTLLGTVPINKAASDWDPRNPPPRWKEAIHRWETLDSVRTVLAICAFGLAPLSV
jgi:uncharacterized membrane protein